MSFNIWLGDNSNLHSPQPTSGAASTDRDDREQQSKENQRSLLERYRLRLGESLIHIGTWLKDSSDMVEHFDDADNGCFGDCSTVD